MKNAYDPQQGQTLTDHLTELRIRLIKSFWAIIGFSVICWIFNEEIFAFVRDPILPLLPSGGLIFTSPSDKFMVSVKLAILGGVVFSCPVWLYQVWRFVAPGLYKHERKYGLLFIGSGTALFAVGLGFAYFLAIPTALKFLLEFGGATDKPLITIKEYMSFFMTMTLVFGAAFELPLVIVILGAMGILSQETLRKNRRYAVVILAIMSALLTPPDVLSMAVLLVPMWALFEISVLIVGIVARPAQVESKV